MVDKVGGGKREGGRGKGEGGRGKEREGMRGAGRKGG